MRDAWKALIHIDLVTDSSGIRLSVTACPIVAQQPENSRDIMDQVSCVAWLVRIP